jgi:isopropylmalate/homocitrate/citramalate synthase
MKKPTIFDTTLREGEQTPTVVFKPEQKIELARKFSEFGVNYIDVMPAVSENEKKIVKRLVKEKLNAEITATCRLKKEDINDAIECDVKRITLFTPLSDLHLKYLVGIDKKENLERAVESIEYARSHGLRIDFAAVDASRTDEHYLRQFIKKISEKVETVFISDSMGCWTPKKTYEIVKSIKDYCKSLVGLHEHNDFGLATANTLAGLEAGADVFSGTFTGIGPRGGNTPNEEICMALEHLYKVPLGLKYGMLSEICGLVEKYSGFKVQNHKPIIGEYVYTHETGLHVAALSREPKTFENFEPSIIGRTRRILVGKQSGKTAIKYVLQKNGRSISEDDASKLLKKIKSLSEYEGRSFSEKEVVRIYEKNTSNLSDL